MLIWIIYVVVVSAFLGIAAYSAERSALVREASTRWYWVLAIVASLILPTLISSVSIEVPAVSNTTYAEEEPFALKDVTSRYLSPAIWISGSFIEESALRKNSDLVTRLWISLSVILLLGLLLSAAQLYWRKGKWQQTVLLERPVLLAKDTGPAVVGLIQPRIVIPAWIFDLPVEQQKAIIAHEQSHLDARDPLLLTVAISLLVLMPWNIVLWWQVYRLRRAIEIDCDRRVLKQGQNLDEYGETLIAVGSHHSGYVGAVAGMAESNSFLETRLKIMINKKIKWRRAVATTMAILSFGFIAVAAQVSPPNAEIDDIEQSTISLSEYELEKYTGNYQFDSSVMTVFQNEGQLFAQLTGQPPLEIYPTSIVDFFAKIVKATITFELDEQKSVTGLILHQGGHDHSMPRIDDIEADRISNEIAQRIAGQLPKSGSEAAVRGLITGLASGEPDYSLLSPVMQEAIKEQLPKLHSATKYLGELYRLEFRGVGNSGWDMFEAHHENGSSTWRINIDESGIIIGALVNAGP